MRDIKFRAWDVRQKVMIPDAIIATEARSLLTTTLDLQNHFAHFDGVKWMQFTGLEDKNKKECYESDIIINENGDKRLIQWCYTGFEMRLLNGNRETSNTTWYHTFEIVGNIYENPELLNDLSQTTEDE